MKISEKETAIFELTKSSSIVLFLFAATAILLLNGCGGISSHSRPDLLKTSFKEETPESPDMSDESMCKEAGKLAESKGYNPPVCLYIGQDGNIKARPGGRIALQNTPEGIAQVIMFANTGTHPIQAGKYILKPGEVLFWKKSGNQNPQIDVPGIFLTPVQD